MDESNTRIGFIGLGKMGLPMAINLARNFPLIAWNRTTRPNETLAELRVQTVPSCLKVFREASIIFIMLYDERAIESVMTQECLDVVSGKIVINTSSVSVDFSTSISHQLQKAGAAFIEMPVSGSRGPAEQGQLVGLIAGDVAVADRIKPYVAPLTSKAIYCGPVGSGLKMKFAINLFATATAVGLAESLSLANAQGLDSATFAEVLNAGPMSSAYSKSKMTKILDDDYSAQASINDCHKGCLLVVKAAEDAGAQTPVMKLCTTLYGKTIDEGLGDQDMIAIVQSLRGYEAP